MRGDVLRVRSVDHLALAELKHRRAAVWSFLWVHSRTLAWVRLLYPEVIVSVDGRMDVGPDNQVPLAPLPLGDRQPPGEARQRHLAPARLGDRATPNAATTLSRR